MGDLDKDLIASVKEALRFCKKKFNIEVLELIDCGDFGCVFTTSDPNKVLKIGDQWNEYHAAKYLLERHNKVHVKFPNIHNVWDLSFCYPKIPFYAVLRENIPDAIAIDNEWFGEVTADLESLCEWYAERSEGLSNDKIFEISANILEERPGKVADELQFEKLVEFYSWSVEHEILLTDTLLENFGQRSDGELVLRDLGGVYLLKRNPEGISQPHREMFRFGKNAWDINKANELISRRKSKKLQSVNVEEIYNQSMLMVKIDRNYALTQADVTKPIVFGLMKVEKQWYAILIDGHHRLYRAKHENIKTLPAYFLTKAENTKVAMGVLGRGKPDW